MKDRVCEALRFAIDHYDNVGIGYDGNYFFPPMEMLSLLNGMAMAEKNQNLLIAGILYNIVEDTDVTIDMVWEEFGREVAHLVGEHLLFLHLGWEDGEPRKEEKLKKAVSEIKKLKESDMDIKILTLCDTVVKQRLLKRELIVKGKEAWKKQGVQRELLCSYFSKIQDDLYDLQFDKVLAPAYWEMVNTFKDLFVSFYYDRDNQRMIQICADGEAFVIARSDLQAKPWEGELPETAIPVQRQYAERIEDNWGEEYNLKKRAENHSFEEYYVAVKNHVRGFLKNAKEDDLDRLLITNLDYIRERYNEDIERLIDGMTTMDLFLTEGPTMTADGLERLVGVGGKP